MLTWRPHNLFYEKAMTNASTWKEDLPQSGKCTRLVVTVENPLTGAHWVQVSGFGAHIYHSSPAYRLTKAEIIVDGNHPVKSLTGIEAQLLSFYRNKKEPPDRIRDPALSAQQSIFIFDFGRYFGDPEYFLDWSKHKTSEIRLTNDADGTVYNGMVVTVDEYVAYGVEPAASKGVFVDRQLKEYTTAQNGEESVEIPSVDPIRSIALRCKPDVTTSAPYHYKRYPRDVLNEINLSFLEEKIKLLDRRYAEQVMWDNAHRYGYVRQAGKGLSGARGDAFLSNVGYRLGTVCSFADVVGTALITRYMGAYTYADNPLVINPNATGNDYIDFDCWGMSYHDSFMLYDAEEPVQQNLLGKDEAPIRLKQKTENNANAAGATVDVILSTLEAL